MDDHIYANDEDDDQPEIPRAMRAKDKKPGAQIAMRAKKKKPGTGPPPPLPPLPSTGTRPRERDPEAGPPPLPPGAADRCCRWTAVWLGILCALLLGLSIGLAVWLLTERDQLLTNQINLLTNQNNLLEERDQLMTNYSKLLVERDQLLTNQNNLLEERDQLMTNQSNLLEERDQMLTNSTYYNLLNPAGSFRIFRKVGDKYFSTEGQKGTFDDGLKFCRDAGGDLALPKNEKENEVVVKILSLLEAERGWLGTTDRKTEGTFLDTHGRPLHFTKWADGEPNDEFDIEDCGMIFSNTGTWNDVPCDQSYYVVCEIAN